MWLSQNSTFQRVFLIATLIIHSTTSWVSVESMVKLLSVIGPRQTTLQAIKSSQYTLSTFVRLGLDLESAQ